LLAQAVGQLVMLVETDSGGERKIGTHAHKDAAPAPVVDVEVVLHDPALSDLQMPAVLLGFTDGNHDARRLPRPEDYDDLIWFGSPEVRGDEFIAAATWSVDDWPT
jgi:hypothetical protein